MDGLIISNTTVTRDSDLTGSHMEEVGGLSGRPLNSLSTQLISEMYIATQGKSSSSLILNPSLSKSECELFGAEVRF